jgi:hypothetical protein
MGNRAESAAETALLVVQVAAEARDALDAEREVELALLLEALLLPLRDEAVAEVLRVARGERRVRDRHELAVQADHRRAGGRQVQVGRAALHHLAKECFYGRHRRRESRLCATARGTCGLRDVGQVASAWRRVAPW